MREFILKFGKNFHLKSQFTSFPMKEKESVESFLSNLKV